MPSRDGPQINIDEAHVEDGWDGIRGTAFSALKRFVAAFRETIASEIQVVVTGGTMTASLRSALRDKYLEVRPEEVISPTSRPNMTVSLTTVGSTGVDTYAAVHAALARIDGQVVVFVSRQDDVDAVIAGVLAAEAKVAKGSKGVPMELLGVHGGMEPALVETRIVAFRNGEASTLVATSVAALGIDYPLDGVIIVGFMRGADMEDQAGARFGRCVVHARSSCVLRRLVLLCVASLSVDLLN